MAIDCTNPPCKRRLPLSSIISVFGQTSLTENTDCSLNLLYLIDEAGLVNQADAASDPYLTTTARTKQIGAFEDVQLHFDPCGRVYWELSQFFSWVEGELQRPRTITVGYFDSANETMQEALDEIFKCFTCFNVVSHVTYDINQGALYDTAVQLELAEWATLNEKLAVLPTIDETNLIVSTETTSNAYQAKDGGYRNSIFVLLNEECIPELDTDCNATGNTVNTYGVQHLGLASILSSLSDQADDYFFTAKFTPKNDAFEGMSTSLLSLEDTRSVIGTNPYLGGINVTSNHYVNVYHSLDGTDIYLEGLTATGNYIDDILHRIYIKRFLEKQIFTMLMTNKAVSISDLSKLQNILSLSIRDIVDQGLITDEANAIDKTKFSDIFLSGNGWVLTKADTKQSNLTNRITPTFTLCYVRPGATHYVSIGLCESGIQEG